MASPTGILGEADLGAGLADEGLEIAERVRARLGDAREGLGGIDSDGVEFAVQVIAEELDRQQGARAVDGVQGDAEAAAADALHVDV